MPMTVTRHREMGKLIPPASFGLSIDAAFVGHPARGAPGHVVAPDHGSEMVALHVDAETRPVDDRPVVLEDVVESPARVDLVHRESVVIAMGTGVALDEPVVALDVDPGRGRRLDHPRAVEDVPGDDTAGGAFLDV